MGRAQARWPTRNQFRNDALGAMTAAPLLDSALTARVGRARATAVAALLAARDGAPHWTGELSASALSTATAVTALTLVARGDHATAARAKDTIRRGYAWLAQNQMAAPIGCPADRSVQPVLPPAAAGAHTRTAQLPRLRRAPILLR